MRTLCVKDVIKLLLVFTLCLCLDCSNGRTIDSMIARASRLDTYKDPKSGYTPGGAVLSELDMLLTREQYNALHSQKNTFETTAGKTREASRLLFRRWTNNQVPYRIQPNHFSKEDRETIMRAIDYWEKYTCITFQQATPDDFNVLYFEDGRNCQSRLGMSGGKQSVNLGKGCRYTNVIIHEIGHAVGFIHEHNRADRDDYVIINYTNINPSSSHNFYQYDLPDGTSFGVPYDYTSIMHYGGTAFTINGNKTIVTKDPAFQEVIGKQDWLSFNDIKLANLMYNCNEQCRSSRRCPKEGFLGKDCRCWCPGNPVKECGENIATESPPVQSTLKPKEEPTRPTERPTTRQTERPTTRQTERPATRQTERPKTRPTERPTTRPTMNPTSTTKCRDMDPDCVALAKLGYCRRDFYVYRHCKASCFLCDGDIATKRPPVIPTWKPIRGPTTSATKRPTATTTCTDANPSCPDWAKIGYCKHNRNVKTHCKASCFLCEGDIATKHPPVILTRKPIRGPTTRPIKRPTPTNTCMDMDPDCPTAAKLGYCRGDSYVQTHCKASCSLCEEVTKRPPVKPTRKPTDRLITRTTESPIATIVCTDTDPDCSVWANLLALLSELTEVYAK